MKTQKLVALAALIAILQLTLVTSVCADAAARITWYAFSSGGGHTQSSNYSLDGTVGQSAPGLAHSPNFCLGSGFWYVTGVPQVVERLVFLPVVLRTYP